MTKDDIINAIAKSGLSQTKFAKAIRVTQPAVSYWVNGKKSPRPRVVKRIQKLLKHGVQRKTKKPVFAA
jgi:predicted transcriptional regulator